MSELNKNDDVVQQNPQVEMNDSNHEVALKESADVQIQVFNVVTWLLAMALNGISATSLDENIFKPLDVITDEVDVRISPDNQAFGIWSLIQTLLSIFAIQQALPDSLIQSRNNKLIFEEIGYYFGINMLLNGIWLALFRVANVPLFIISAFEIVLILATCVQMMMLTLKSQLNVVEWISMRLGISIQSGWVTAATILNISFALKESGMSEANGVDEQLFSIVIVWVALVVYNVVQVAEKNPIYAAVQIWVLIAIRENVIKKMPAQDLGNLKLNLEILVGIHSVLILGWVGQLSQEKYDDKTDKGMFQ